MRSWFFYLVRLFFAFILPLLVYHFLKGRYGLPKIIFKRYAVILIVNFFLVGWLESTGFFVEVVPYMYTFSWSRQYSDPHGWVWFIGKAVGTLIWPLAVEKPKKFILN